MSVSVSPCTSDFALYFSNSGRLSLPKGLSLWADVTRKPCSHITPSALSLAQVGARQVPPCSLSLPGV